MKKLLFILVIVIFPVLFSAQSISASKILDYANSQNIATITKELKQLGFQTRTDNSEGYPIYQFAKKTSRGVEKIEIGKNSELFMFTYKCQQQAYDVYKNKLLTNDYKYSYSYTNNKYYENGRMRIGINDLSSIISIFKPLK